MGVLNIDRVNAKVQVEPGEPAAQALQVADLSHDQRRQFRDLVLDILGDHLRGLERRGVI